MVAEQRETVQRIDADTIDIASNVGGAQRELLKYYASISSNRWLMLKVFGVLIVFVRLFSLLLDDLQLTVMLAVFTLYLSIMTDFVQPWLCLAVVIRIHHVDGRYAPWTTYCLIHMHTCRELLSDWKRIYTSAKGFCPCATLLSRLLPPTMHTLVAITDSPSTLCAGHVAFP